LVELILLLTDKTQDSFTQLVVLKFQSSDAATRRATQESLLDLIREGDDERKVCNDAPSIITFAE